MKYTKAESAYLRRLYERWKKERGVGLNATPLHEDPVVVGSLRLLLEDNGYSYTDVAAWLGLSKERIRQLANKAGIFAPHAKHRVWDDDANRFVCVGDKLQYDRVAAEELKARRRRERNHTLALRWDRAIMFVRSFAAEHGRPPVLKEMCSALTPELTAPAFYATYSVRLGYNFRKDSYRAYIPKVYELAGAEQPDAGWHGHVSNLDVQDTCNPQDQAV